MVTYGKTLGGGLPIGVVAGTHSLMKRYKAAQTQRMYHWRAAHLILIPM